MSTTEGDAAPPDEPTDASDVAATAPAPPPRTPTARRLGGLVVRVGLVLLVLFTPLAWLVTTGEPLPVVDVTRTSLVRTADGPGPRVQAVPVGLPADRRITAAADLAGLARDALGADGARTLATILASPDSIAETAVGGSTGFAPYPYVYPAARRLLAAAPLRPDAWVALAAGLIRLAAIERQEATSGRNAGPLAYAVLHRLGTAGGCAGQLDLLLLLAADDQPRDRLVEAQGDVARAACPGDPTPDWLLGQFESQRAIADPFSDAPGDRPPADRMTRAISRFDALTRSYPQAADVWVGLGDARLRVAAEVTPKQRFSGRSAYRAAYVAYQRGEALGSEDAVVGEARALIGLGQPDRAVALLTPRVGAAEHPGPEREVLLLAQESARDFAAATLTAQALAAGGSGAFPDRTLLFADQTPFVPPADGLDRNGPLTTGIGRWAPFRTQLQPGPGGANSDVTDGSFIPAFRSDAEFVGSNPWCAGWSAFRDALLARQQVGEPAATYDDVRPDQVGSSCGPAPRTVANLLSVAVGRAVSDQSAEERAEAYERWQNLWRWAGDLDEAALVAQRWDDDRAARPNGSRYLPALRLGEIRYLQGRWDDAAAAFDVAARRGSQGFGNDPPVSTALLDRGAALLAGDRPDEAVPLLRGLTLGAATAIGYFTANPKVDGAADAVALWATIDYHVRSQLGDAERRSGALAAAGEDYRAALDRVGQATGRTGLRPEAVQNNLAIVETARDRLAEAETAAEQALAADPANPAFAMTAGYVSERAGRTDEAMARNRTALASDPGAYPAANDLGVQLARTGHHAEAVQFFREAVGARPDYALGWFNLGVLRSRHADLVRSQGDLARAIALDPALADAQRVLTIDAGTYRSGLDLSRPLPPGWSFADVQKRAPAASAGLLAAVLLALGIARSSGGSSDAQQWLDLTAQRLAKLPGLRRLRRPGWAVAGTALAFLLPLLWAGGPGFTETVAFVVAVLLLSGAVLTVRAWTAQRNGVPAAQQAWAPGLVVGVVSGALGTPWAPLPTVAGTEDPVPVHRAAPLLLAGIAAVLLVESVLVPAPFTHRVGVAVVIMVGSLLLPVRPLDGARLGAGGKLAALGVVGTAVLLALGLI